jgi:hypothetical protein
MRVAPLLSRRGILGGAWAAGLAGAAVWAMAAGAGARGLFNDYYDYWAAARVVARRGDPYDPHVLGNVLTQAGVHSGVGDFGYSYPLLLAELMRPLALLPSQASAILFTAASLAALGLAVALVLSFLAPRSTLAILGLATVAGLFAPVLGSLYFGQVNLFVLALLALALRGVQRPLTLGLAAAVKLYPIAAVAAVMSNRERGARLALLTLSAGAVLIVIPNLVAGHGPHPGSALRMFGPDPYWSNASLNGWLSRLGLAWQWLPVTALWLAISAAFGAVCLSLVRRATWPSAYGLLLCFAVVVAPKNSLWNFAPLVITFACAWTSGLGRRWVGVLLLAWSLIAVQGPADLARYSVNGPLALGLSGMALAGAFLLFAVLAHGVVAGPTTRQHRWPAAA